MADEIDDSSLRGVSSITYWKAECKDCVAERRRQRGGNQRKGRIREAQSTIDPGFEYSGNWAEREYELGHTRSDRCERHRRLHRQAIRALAVPYVDLDVIGQVRNLKRPTGPLGGLGPLPKAHRRDEAESNLQGFGFGMSDADILEILAGLKHKRVAVIEAGTGSGKSTFMPFRLMNPPAGAPYRPTGNGPIVVTEPRRAAATGVGTFVGEALAFGHNSQTCQAHVGPGFPVGYQVSGDRNWDNACDLIYVTDGTMINWVRDGSLARIGMVIVDEAHERSENIDIILAQLREKVHEYKHLRVIITSATIDRDFFISYFGGDDQVFHHYVPEKKSFGYGIPLFVDLEIDDRLIASGLELSAEGEQIAFPGWSGLGPENLGFPPDDLVAETARYARLRLDKKIPIENWRDEMADAVARQVLAIAEGTDWGDILGFLPTTKKIEEAIGKINQGLEQRGLEFDVYPLLSSTDDAITEKAVTARSRGDKRKIVISSNLAETSLTVSGVRYVVDSGLICQSAWNTELASGALITIPHSRAGLRQRWGRVGRDAPGWVFPLYTSEQFLSLARDTPPESTRKNLESFCSKLISAGLDLENAALPASFESPIYNPDDFGRQASNTFRNELTRAHRTLRATGLVDGDGDLTELGREVDRYPGDASEALAIALGDRLACLHEVALAIAVLTSGTLYGRRPDCILRTDFDWPSEWRLRAAACHKALAAGCTDDLELLVRIASLYQSAEDGKKWCQTWWVNKNGLDAALEKASGTIANLSAAMKGKADRPMLPQLLPRVRAALSRAFHGLSFERDDDGRFKPVGNNDTLPATLPERRLASSTDLVIAFKRYENDRDPANVQRHISHLVNVVEWAVHDTDSADSGFDLLLELGRQRHSGTNEGVPDSDLLARAREQLPIGTIARLSFGPEAEDGLAEVTGLAIDIDPFLARIDSPIRGVDDNDPGFDREWDLIARKNRSPDEEGNTEKPLDLLDLEDNDEFVSPSEQIIPIEAVDTSREAPPIFARLMFEETPLVSGEAYLISEYAIQDNRPVVCLEPFDKAQQDIDPACHDKYELLDEIDVEFLGVPEDPYWSFLSFRCLGTNERFDVPAKGFFSLDRFVEASAGGLTRGLAFRAAVIAPQPGQRSITLKPWLRAQFDKVGDPRQAQDGQANRLYPAEIIAKSDQRDNVLVGIEDLIEPGEIALRTQVPARWLGEEKGIPAEIGQRLRVGFEDSPDRRVELKPVNEELSGAIAKISGRLEIRGEKAIALHPVDLNLARRLAQLDESEKWASAVSILLDGSQTVRTVVALPPIRRSTIAASKLASSLLKKHRFRRELGEFQQRYKVRVEVEQDGSIAIQTDSAVALQSAIDALNALEQSAYIAARLPEGSIGKVIGTNQETRLSLQAEKGIGWVWVDDGIVYVVGDSLTNVRIVIKRIREIIFPVTGTLTVPGDQIGAFFGEHGMYIKFMTQESHCRVDRIGRSNHFRIIGDREAYVTSFLGYARLKAPGLTFQKAPLPELETLSERKRASRQSEKESMGRPSKKTSTRSTKGDTTKTARVRRPDTTARQDSRQDSLSQTRAAKNGSSIRLVILLVLVAIVLAVISSFI